MINRSRIFNAQLAGQAAEKVSQKGICHFLNYRTVPFIIGCWIRRGFFLVSTPLDGYGRGRREKGNPYE